MHRHEIAVLCWFCEEFTDIRAPEREPSLARFLSELPMENALAAVRTPRRTCTHYAKAVASISKGFKARLFKRRGKAPRATTSFLLS
eukprot:3664733-Amphidinium_carterae.1